MQVDLNGARKAAALIAMLGEEVSSQILKFLWEDEIEQIGKELAVLGAVPAEAAGNILEEFHRMSLGSGMVSAGGPEYTRKLFSKALGPDVSRRVLDRVTRSLETSIGFGAVDKADPEQLSRFIQNEHPQTIALVLAHLDPQYGAQLLASLPEEIRADVVTRIANLGEISPDVIRRISSILSQKLASLGTPTRQTIGGPRAVAEMVNKMDRSIGRNILEKIEQENSELAINIRNLMLVFDDLLLVDSAGLREVLQRVDKKVLTLALKGTSEELQAHIFKNMSQRATEMLKEDMQALGPVRLREVEQAQREVVAVIQKLEEEGIVSIRGGGADQYVV
ncbi:MAG: flagellar motor switch protein FliG [Acidobacteria bacterium]|nr:MAG: flagellar motor switch protein FliG [Acidobacteriota bacterium]